MNGSLFSVDESTKSNPPPPFSERIRTAIFIERQRWSPSIASVSKSVSKKKSSLDEKFAIYDSVRKGLDGFFKSNGQEMIPIVREPLQARFQSEMLKACIPCIFREDLQQKKQLILKRLRLRKIYKRVQVFAARRMGKTFSVCILFAALLLFVPDLKIAAFGTTKNTAMMIVDETYKLLVTHNAFLSGGYKVHRNVSRIKLIFGGTERLLTAYASTTKVTYIYIYMCVCGHVN